MKTFTGMMTGIQPLVVVALLVVITISSNPAPAISQVTLSCDFSSSARRKKPMHYHWNVSNRISPIRRFNMPVGERPLINVVRPLGGKAKDGKKILEQDTYKWNGQEYVYDWVPLKQQIDTVSKKARVYQLLIDNPPWAFQRGLDLKGGKEVETYGNAWPPNDPDAWSSYIQAMLKELIKTYGRNKVEKWRFCIGREIGTAGHWRGSKLEFFEHYKNTESAIRSVLRKAKVGTHFLWASSKNSYGPDFVKWCKRNKATYDFIGVSYYPFYNKLDRVDLEHVYKADFAPIKDISAWNSSATLEIHEFSLITSMGGKGNTFENASKPHQESFTVMLAKMMYDHDIVDVFRWGTGENKLAEQTLQAMEGNIYYQSSERGSPTSAGNMIDAVFAHDESKRQYNVVAYSYNAEPDAKKTEQIKLLITIPESPDSEIKFRNGVYDENEVSWTDWKRIETKSAGGGEKSKLKLNLDLPPFSFEKVEIKVTKRSRRQTKPAEPKKQRVTRVLTQRKTGKQIEVELADLKSGKLLCYMGERRFVITVADLSDEDQAFLKKWVEEK